MSSSPQKKVTVTDLLQMKAAGRKISMLTAYDATFARLIDDAGIDLILVGDSLGMVIQGEETTIPVRLEDMVYHTRAVCRGVRRAHVVADLPFMSYQGGKNQALESAGRLMKEGNAQSVKLEGGQEYAETVRWLVRAGIPVMGHIGLTPQSVHALGGFKVQGKSPVDARRIAKDAKALEEAGAYSVVLEGIPQELASIISSSLRIPTIGIGAGPSCDGQVLVIYDLLGMNPDFKPKFVKRYFEAGAAIRQAVEEFREEIAKGSFPAEEHSYRTKVPLFEPAAGSPELDDEPETVSGLYGVPV